MTVSRVSQCIFFSRQEGMAINCRYTARFTYTLRFNGKENLCAMSIVIIATINGKGFSQKVDMYNNMNVEHIKYVGSRGRWIELKFVLTYNVHTYNFWISKYMIILKSSNILRYLKKIDIFSFNSYKHFKVWSKH